MSIIDDLQSGVDNAWNSIATTGAPTVIAGLENYASDQLKGEAGKNQAAAQAAVTKAMQSGQPATGILKSIQDMFGNVASGAVFHKYGLMIVLGLVGLLVVGSFIL